MSNEVAVELLAQGAVTTAGLRTEYGISRSRAYELMNARQLPYTMCGRKRLIPRLAVVRLLAATMVGGLVEGN
jgi:excisionase family DNA binding protein